MKYEAIEKIVKNAINGDEFQFSLFLEKAFNALQPKLDSLTRSEEDSKEIFIISMQKFWERFIIDREELPSNTIGYIYIMCKNVWLTYKRNIWSSVILDSTLSAYQKKTINHYLNPEDENVVNTEDLWLKYRALSIALEEMSPKCKMLLETDLNPEMKLKELQERLGYINYQALVQAKYNCKKKLIQKVFKALNNLKENDGRYDE